MTDPAACKNCKYYAYATSECRRLPKQAFTFTDISYSYDKDTPDDEYVNSDFRWPQMADDDWCGEFREKEDD